MSQNRAPSRPQNGSQPPEVPEPEVVQHPTAGRRVFSPAYKLRILAEADECSQPGEIGALLRREGLYSSLLDKWRRQRREGRLPEGMAQKRGRKASRSAEEQQILALQREIERLRAQLGQAELIIAAQKKLAQALEQTLRAHPDGKS